MSKIRDTDRQKGMPIPDVKQCENFVLMSLLGMESDLETWDMIRASFPHWLQPRDRDNKTQDCVL